MIKSYEYPRRNAARLIIISPESRVLLFRFAYQNGPLTGRDYWATPGGKVENGESYETAAIRELYEETGIVTLSIGSFVADKEFVWRMSTGELVVAVEKYFVVYADNELVSVDGWSVSESEVLVDYKWWSDLDLQESTAEIWPADLREILKRIKSRKKAKFLFGALPT